MSDLQVETETTKKDLRRYRGIYLLPNLLTTVGLFFGFYAVVAALKGVYDDAAKAIFVAMLADFLDGRVARMTHTQSAFGAEYDSLSDMLAFGVAPALVSYSWALIYLDKIGWLVAFCYAAATALRLARFNIQVNISKRYFRGLPSPAAAGVIASLVWVLNDAKIDGGSIAILVAIVTFLAGVLMVSNIRYYSFKEIDLRGRVPFSAVLIIVVILVSVSINPPIMFVLVFYVYAISGPAVAGYRLYKQVLQQREIIRQSSGEAEVNSEDDSSK